MARVTLEGSITPSTYLARGARITVERTPYVDKLIRAGYVNVVETPPAKEEVEAIVAPKLAAAKKEQVLSAQAIGRAPSRAASGEVWAEFLTKEMVDFPEGANRSEMLARWDAAVQTVTEAESDGGPTDR